MEADKAFTAKSVNFKACNMVVDEKLNLKNYLHDAMDFHAVRQLIVKSRHKILMPILVLHLTKTKLKTSGGYSSSFARNLHERTDNPVFTIQDAVKQIRAGDNGEKPRGDMEKAMDEFFLTHLPEEILAEGGPVGDVELNENAIRHQKREIMKENQKKYFTQTECSSGDPLKLLVDPKKITSGEQAKPKRQKSDLTMGFTDSGVHVEKLARKSETAEKIDKMRKQAKQATAIKRNTDFGRLQSQEEGLVNSRPSSGRNSTGRNTPKRSTMSPDAFRKKYSAVGGQTNGHHNTVNLASSGFKQHAEAWNESSSGEEDDGTHKIQMVPHKPQNDRRDEDSA